MNEAFLQNYNQFLQEHNLSFLLLFATGFVGGLASSLLPCVLSLLPVNLAYIGTLEAHSKWEALKDVTMFVLGVTIVITLLGVSSSFAFGVFTEYKGIINIIVGLLIICMAFSLFDFFKIPFPQIFKKIPDTHPFIIGLAFALVSSPCSSPVLISVISVAAASKSLFTSFLITFGYSLGYTAIIFVASLSTGLIKQLDWFKHNHDKVVKISATVLLLVGVYYTIVGISNLI